MANLSEDIQCAGSDTRPPMLDKTDFASWQQRIRLYCRGKENGDIWIIEDALEDRNLTKKDREFTTVSMTLNTFVRTKAKPFTTTTSDPVCDEAGPSYDSDILSEVHDHDHFQDAICEHHEEHGMQDDVQPSYVVGSHADYTSDSNMTPYDQYVKDNAVPVVQNNASTVPNDMYVMIDNDLHEPKAQSVCKTPQNTVVNNLLNAELATYKEQVELYERRDRFELTEREQKIDEQLIIVICDRNIKEENLKKELHSVKLKLASTIQHNKLMVDEVTSLKKDFTQKENKYLEEFLDLKALKDKVEDKLFKQGQSIQTVHMMCKPRSYYDEVNKVAIGYKNPLCLHRARQVQPALYSGHVIVTPNHAPAVVRDCEETLEQSEISRKKMHDKMKAN
ncbi:hypothetical protein Tco_0417238 [Tanacetum coccineum]